MTDVRDLLTERLKRSVKPEGPKEHLRNALQIAEGLRTMPTGSETEQIQIIGLIQIVAAMRDRIERALELMEGK